MEVLQRGEAPGLPAATKGELVRDIVALSARARRSCAAVSPLPPLSPPLLRCWSRVGSQREFISALICPKPSKRPTAKAALDLPWLRNVVTGEEAGAAQEAAS